MPDTHRLGLAVLLGTLPVMALAQGPEAPAERPLDLETFRAPVMGTELQVRIVVPAGKTPADAEAAFRSLLGEFERLETLLSEWKSDSPFGRLNTDPEGGPVVLPDEAYALLERALQWSARSEGAFDPSFASLWGLWRFDPGDETRIPTRAEARKRATLIDYRRVVLDPATHSVKIDPGMKLGLGGIAKGYAVDQATRRLRAQGFSDFFVKCGGELFLSGRKGKTPWVVGIQDPRDRDHYFATLAVEDGAFTTSGDYERFLIHDGVRYHHIIDPATGYPGRRCRQVTVLAPRAEDADALSTTLFVLGPEKGMALVKGLPNVEAVFVDAEGRVIVSPGLKGRLQLEPLTPYEGP